MNSRHPCPRRVLGRCRAAVRGQDPGDPLDPGDPGMESFLRVLGVNSSKMEPGDAPVQCFFDFFMTAPSRTPSFEGGTPHPPPLQKWLRGSLYGCIDKPPTTTFNIIIVEGAGLPQSPLCIILLRASLKKHRQSSSGPKLRAQAFRGPSTGLPQSLLF